MESEEFETDRRSYHCWTVERKQSLNIPIQELCVIIMWANKDEFFGSVVSRIVLMCAGVCFGMAVSVSYSKGYCTSDSWCWFTSAIIVCGILFAFEYALGIDT